MKRIFFSTTEGLGKAWKIFDSVKSFDDIEREFLLGAGLSKNTYRNYLQTVKKFYEFTGGMHPLQVKPADIERFYDYIMTRVDRNTAYLHVCGLKKFFASIKKKAPVCTNPFDTMSENLKRKLNTTKKGGRTKKALTPEEIRDLLTWLGNDMSVQGLENYAIVYMLVTSGLRGEELCGLRWGDLECCEDRWTAYFVGKGGKQAEQELYGSAVKAARTYFIKAFQREPQSEDALFWTVPAYPHDTPRPMPYPTLWYRIHKIGKAAKEAGVIKREIPFSPHLFRRTYATCLYKSGMGIKAIQKKTRHANIETLVKYYIHDTEDATPYLKNLFTSKKTKERELTLNLW